MNHNKKSATESISQVSPKTHLVLGGGGVAGIAWMTGLLLALEENGFHINQLQRLVGTSAGATVAAQISSGTPLSELYQRQTDPQHQVGELKPDISLPRLGLSLMMHLLLSAKNPQRYRRRIGKMARKTNRVAPEDRRAVIEQRLPSHQWPDMDLNIITVNTATGEPRCLDRSSQIDLVDAVTASCAVPGIWPTVQLDDGIYMDGGMQSTDNALYARGADRLLVISPMGGSNPLIPGETLEEDLAVLEQEGTQAWVIKPDETSKLAMGKDPLEPTTRQPAAEAGYQQGLREVDRVMQTLGLS
ncbi:MAG: patatin-like phospholipase family protein [Candidatus Pelagadaptatus aseana]|uniref:patatin-like phospholipase family protein n=1 Tax=Candidatus Pelagadaptatus aseana TaxID=3120508 RepID=UPI0039B19F83